MGWIVKKVSSQRAQVAGMVTQVLSIKLKYDSASGGLYKVRVRVREGD